MKLIIMTNIPKLLLFILLIIFTQFSNIDTTKITLTLANEPGELKFPYILFKYSIPILSLKIIYI